MTKKENLLWKCLAAFIITVLSMANAYASISDEKEAAITQEQITEVQDDTDSKDSEDSKDSKSVEVSSLGESKNEDIAVDESKKEEQSESIEENPEETVETSVIETVTQKSFSMYATAAAASAIANQVPDTQFPMNDDIVTLENKDKIIPLTSFTYNNISSISDLDNDRVAISYGTSYMRSENPVSYRSNAGTVTTLYKTTTYSSSDSAFWSFDRLSDGSYIIRGKKPTDKTDQYIKCATKYDNKKNYGYCNITYTSSVDSATPFTIIDNGDGTYKLKTVLDSKDFYFVVKNSSYFCVANYSGIESDTATKLNIKTRTFSYTGESKRYKAMATDPNPSGMSVNLFDYWISADRYDNDATDDYVDPESGLKLDSGINKNKALKFTANQPYGSNNANKWTGSANPFQGILQKNLVDGYPALSTEPIFGTPNSGYAPTNPYAGESLRYLFDPTMNVEHRATYTDVDGLFTVNEDGYYEYRSTDYFAEYNEEDNRFYVYDGLTNSNSKQFFPFNKVEQFDQHKSSSCYESWMNHYFGLNLTSRFIQKNGGFTDASREKAVIFDFIGDDDVWIYIDNVLVGDLGGIHNAGHLTIDFSTGQVNAGTYSTTIREAYENAGVSWNNPGSNTFADGSTHTMKFYFLERGNNLSNMQLKFNLISSPATSIYKVDQYGSTIADANFAVYKIKLNTDKKTYTIPVQDGEGNTVYVDSLDEYNQVEGQPIGVISDGIYTAYPDITGATNYKGEFTFSDDSDSPYTTPELEELLTVEGSYKAAFIIKEIGVPDGYRKVSEETALYFDSDILMAVDSFDSGVWPVPNVNCYAPRSIKLDDDTIKSLDPDTGDGGIMFGIVMKKDNADSIADLNGWSGVYGNNKLGYKTIPFDTDAKTTAINTMKIQNGLAHNPKGNTITYTNSQFTLQGSDYVCFIDTIPGDAERYMSYIRDRYFYNQTVEDILNAANDPNHEFHDKANDIEYTIVYLYSTASNLAGVTPDNTQFINETGSTFSLGWGSYINVPNVENKLYVESKAYDAPTENTDGVDATTPINGVVFGMYSAKMNVEDNSSVILSGDKDVVVRSDGTCSYNGEEGVWTPNESTGDISCEFLSDTVVFSPANNGAGEKLFGATTNDVYSGDGTISFGRIIQGRYALIKLNRAPGTIRNGTISLIDVHEDAVCANAGTNTDGVIVGNGAGYLVSTMNTFASKGQIDETLTWVRAYLKVYPIHTFDEFDHDSGMYAKRGTSSVKGMSSQITADPAQALTTYLAYDPDSDGSMFEYRPNIDQTERHRDGKTLPAGEGTTRLFTDYGWSSLEIYQDTAMGSNATVNNTDYTEIPDVRLTRLFSNSTFITSIDVRFDTKSEINAGNNKGRLDVYSETALVSTANPVKVNPPVNKIATEIDDGDGKDYTRAFSFVYKNTGSDELTDIRPNIVGDNTVFGDIFYYYPAGSSTPIEATINGDGYLVDNVGKRISVEKRGVIVGTYSYAFNRTIDSVTIQITMDSVGVKTTDANQSEDWFYSEYHYNETPPPPSPQDYAWDLPLTGVPDWLIIFIIGAGIFTAGITIKKLRYIRGNIHNG